jgi:lipoprotein-releasing system permease protein
MSTLGVALGVGVLVIVESVMNGFQEDIKHRIVQTQGEIRVECGGQGVIEDPEGLEKKFNAIPEIAATAPYICAAVMMMYRDIPLFPMAKGIDIEKESSVTDIKGILQCGSLKDMKSDEIIVNEQLATHLGICIGDRVEIYTPLALEALANDTVIFPREVRIAGYFSAKDCDQAIVLCPLSLMQDLYAMDRGVHGFLLKLKEGCAVESIRKHLQNILGNAYRVTDWIQGNSALLFALRWEKTMMFFVLLFILLVSSFSISSTLMTNVIRKTREIGLMIALGGNRHAVAQCFGLQGLFIGIGGTLLGMGGGIMVLHFRSDIIKFAHWALNWEGAQRYLSQFIELPVVYARNDFLWIALFSILICIASGIFPALNAARIKPSEALRFEQ